MSGFSSFSGFGGASSGLGTNGFEVSLNYYTGIPDPNVLSNNSLKLIFKSLLKRDEVTREKAIVELLNFIETDSNKSEIINDELLIISWVQLYAKLSIDNSKKIRSTSHQIQSKFVVLLGKKYLKSLRDTIGIWLNGCFDNDRNNSRICIQSLQSAFNDNTEKINNLWEVFAYQIINYSSQIIRFETKDSLSDERIVNKEEAETKFNRVLICSIQLLTQIIVKRSGEFKSDSIELLSEIIKDEKFQDLIITKEHQLKKNMFVLLKALISFTPDLMNSKIMKLTSKSIIKSIKPSKKSPNESLLFSTIIIPILDSITEFSKFYPKIWEVKKSKENLLDLLSLGSCNSNETYYSSLNSFINALVDPKNEILLFNFTDFTDKDSQTLINILLKNIDLEKLATHKIAAINCLLDTLTKFLKLSDNEDTKNDIIQFTVKPIIKIIDSPRILQSNSLLQLSTKLNDLKTDDSDVLLEINQDLLNCLPSGPLEIMNSKIINERNFVNHYCFILNKSLSISSAETLESLIQNSVESLDDEQEEYKSPKISIFVLEFILKENIVKFKDAVIPCIENISNYITKEFIDEPLELITTFKNSTFANNNDNENDDDILYKIVDASFLKLKEIDSPNGLKKLLNLISKIPDFKLTNCPNLNNYFLEHSKLSSNDSQTESAHLSTNDIESGLSQETKSTPLNDQSEQSKSDILYKFLTYDILINLFNNCNNHSERLHEFTFNLNKNFQEEPIIKFLTDSETESLQFLNYIWSSQNNKESSKFFDKISTILTNNTVLLSKYYKSLNNFITSVSFKDLTNFDQILGRLPTNELITDIVPITLISEFNSAIGTTPDNRVSMSNTLGSSVFLITDTKTQPTYDESKIWNLVSQVEFIVKYLSQLDSTAMTNSINLFDLYFEFLTIIEVSTDLIYLHNESSSDDSESKKESQIIYEKVFQLRKKLLDFISNSFKSIEFTELIKTFVEGSNLFSHYQKIMDSAELEEATKFYSSRVIKILLSNIIETIPLSEFNSLKDQVKILDLTKQNIFKSIVFISSSKKFLIKSPLFDRFRNQTGAEITSIRSSSQILDKGLKQLNLLNQFMNIDEDDLENLSSSSSSSSSSFVFIPPQRFIMTLNTIENWLDSDIAYDEEFIPVIIQIFEFSMYFIKNKKLFENLPSEFLLKILEIICRITSESINSINSNPELDLSLEYYSLKSLIVLCQNSSIIDDWKTKFDEMAEELIEIFISKNCQIPETSQPVEMVNQLFERIFDRFIDIYKFKDIYSDIWPLISTCENKINLRTLVSILLKLIPIIQDDLVIEITLTKKNSSNNNDGDDDKHVARLPIELLENVLKEPEDYIEFEDPFKIQKFLWSWYLISQHFVNITHQIRQDYISQLRDYQKTDVIFKLFQFIFQQVEIKDIERLKSIYCIDDNEGNSFEYITEFDIATHDDAGADHDEFILTSKKLLIHLLYIALREFGTVSQLWFNSVRDLQLKSNIEKIIVNHISPILVNQEMESLSKKNKDLVDDVFKIKLNSSSNEIRCLYEIDEKNLILDFKLPFNYPLSNIKVNGITRVGVDEKKWKNWILSSQYVINFQNGTIYDSVLNFKNNVKLNFEGYEECAICYSILQASDHSLPTKSCPTCHHKFHAACLYRWLKSSGSSTCPLCRNKFHFNKNHH